MSDRTPTGQTTGLPTGGRQAGDGLTVGEAARRLDLTPDAIRSRLHRGTLEGEKVNGEWRVFLSRQDMPSVDRQDATGTKQGSDGHRQDADRELLDELLQAKDQTIGRLDGEVAYLRAQLEQTNRERAQERERFDVIHREALNRIEALTAGMSVTTYINTEEEATTSSWIDHAVEFAPEAAPETPDPLRAQWQDLTEQLIAELGMEPEAARAAAAEDLGIEI